MKRLRATAAKLHTMTGPRFARPRRFSLDYHLLHFDDIARAEDVNIVVKSPVVLPSCQLPNGVSRVPTRITLPRRANEKDDFGHPQPDN